MKPVLLRNYSVYYQNKNSNDCVPCAIKSITDFYRMPITLDAIKRTLKTDRSGTHKNDYVPGIKKLGLQFRRFRFNFNNVHTSISRGIPVAITYRMNPREAHFSVIQRAFITVSGVETYNIADPYYGSFQIPAELMVELMRKDESWARQVICLYK